MAPIVQTEKVNKIYRIGDTPLHVLHDVTLDFEAGRSVAIVGPSGAGKSTLLHVLGGLDQPDSGLVRFRDRDLYRLGPAERTEIRARHVGFVFQSYHLLPELDVVDNVLLPAMAVYGRVGATRQARGRALELLEAVGLTGRIRHTPLELSGGEQQRVALARALINEPELLLADEPTGNLDTATGEQVLHALFNLTRERRHTLILVTHNLEIAARCDRVIRLRDGWVESDRNS
jgi:putative ABC transport system ATP-binding protein